MLPTAVKDDRRAPPPGDEVPPPAEDHKAFAGLLALVMAVYVAILGAACWIKYRYYLYDDFDLAIFTQALSELRHGSWFSSIRGMHWLGDHSSLILLPLFPLFALAPGAPTLLIIQTLALALGAIPVYRMARRALGGGNAGLAFAGVYLLHPATGYVNLFEFHPEALATPLLLAAIDALHGGRRGRALVWAAAALLAKEDVVLVVAGLGAWAALALKPRPWRFVAGCFALAVASAIITWVALKPLSAGEAEYGAMYRQWGDSPGAILRGVATHPLQALSALVSTPDNPVDTRLKLELWLHLLLPVAFLPLLSPGLLLVALPVLAAHLLSWRPQQHSIVFQYSALVLPFVMASAVLGARRLAAMTAASAGTSPPARWPLLLIGAAVLAQAAYGPFADHPWLQTQRAVQRVRPTIEDRLMTSHRDRALSRIARDAPVVASFEFLPRLATSRNVHSLHHVLSGHFTFSRKRYPRPEGAQVLADMAQMRILPFVNAEGMDRLRRIGPPPSFGRPSASGYVWNNLRGDLIAWGPPGVGDPWRVEPESTEAAPRPILFDSVTACLDARAAIGERDGERTLAIRTRWRRERLPAPLLLLQWRLRDDRGAERLTDTHVLGYGVSGLVAWPIGGVFREEVLLPLPEHTPWKPGAVELRVARRERGRLVAAVSDDPGIAANGGWFSVDTAVRDTLDRWGSSEP